MPAPESPVDSPILVGENFKIKTWKDSNYKKLRQACGISDDFLLNKFTAKNFKPGGGKGGQVMAFTSCRKFIVKELSEGDHKALLVVSDAYTKHMLGGKTLLCIFLMHYLDERTGTKFCVMCNCLTKDPKYGKFDRLYDLKACNDDKLLEEHGQSVVSVHKRIWNVCMWGGECNWTDSRKEYYRKKLGARNWACKELPAYMQEEIHEAISRDVNQFLIPHGLMDYSLVVGEADDFRGQNFQTFNNVPSERSPTCENIEAQSVGRSVAPESVAATAGTSIGGVSRREEISAETQSGENEVCEQITNLSFQDANEGPVTQDLTNNFDLLELPEIVVSHEPSTTLAGHGNQIANPSKRSFQTVNEPTVGERSPADESGQIGVTPADTIVAMQDPESGRSILPTSLQNWENPFLYKGADGKPKVLAIGIIDYLQTWVLIKKVAMMVKVCERNKATIPPTAYGKRFEKSFKAKLGKGEK